MTTTASRTLTQYETELWESDDARVRDDFRRAVRCGMNCRYIFEGTHIEVYSYDGITLDAWEVSRG